jgi:hypothetical protein
MRCESDNIGFSFNRGMDEEQLTHKKISHHRAKHWGEKSDEE